MVSRRFNAKEQRVFAGIDPMLLLGQNDEAINPLRASRPRRRRGKGCEDSVQKHNRSTTFPACLATMFPAVQ